MKESTWQIDYQAKASELTEEILFHRQFASKPVNKEEKQHEEFFDKEPGM